MHDARMHKKGTQCFAQGGTPRSPSPGAHHTVTLFIHSSELPNTFAVSQARFGEGLILSASLRGGPEDGEDVDSRTTAFLSFVHETFPGAKLQVPPLLGW